MSATPWVKPGAFVFAYELQPGDVVRVWAGRDFQHVTVTGPAVTLDSGHRSTPTTGEPLVTGFGGMVKLVAR